MRSAARDPVNIRVPNPAARLRLFCLPYAGAGSAAYREWSKLLPADIEVATVQLPGREWRIQETPIDDMGKLAEDVVASLEPWLDKPYALLGTSMGGTLAFEVALRLRAAGKPAPLCLMILAVGAPHMPEEKLFHDLPDAELIKEIKEFGVMADEVCEHPELMELLLPILRADCKAHETYAYKEAPPFDFPIWVFGGHGDELVTPARLEGWRQHTEGPMRIHMLPGGHLFMDAMPDLLLQSMVRRLYESTA